MQVMLQIVAPLLAFAFSSVTLNYLGRARKRLWLLALVQKPSKGLLLILHLRLFCWDGYLYGSHFFRAYYSLLWQQECYPNSTQWCVSWANKTYRNSLTHLGRSASLSTGFNAIHLLWASDRGSSYEVPHHCGIPILSIQTPDVIPWGILSLRGGLSILILYLLYIVSGSCCI